MEKDIEQGLAALQGMTTTQLCERYTTPGSPEQGY